MKWSWRIGQVAGIGIYLHGTFLILLAWIVLNSILSGHGAISAITAILVVLGVFTIIVFHELGHALTAKRFGIPTKDITLLPIGGMARLERLPAIAGSRGKRHSAPGKRPSGRPGDTGPSGRVLDDKGRPAGKHPE